jgi:hypothetical protein
MMQWSKHEQLNSGHAWHSLKKFKNKQKKDIVVATYGVFMKVLSGDPNIDFPKAGRRSYTIIQDDGSGRPTLVPVV